MKTDKLFYRIFLSQPELIAELLSGIPVGCEFDYSAPVVKEKEVRLDGLLMPKSDDLTVPLVFLEAQMQPDVSFYGVEFRGALPDGAAWWLDVSVVSRRLVAFD